MVTTKQASVTSRATGRTEVKPVVVDEKSMFLAFRSM